MPDMDDASLAFRDTPSLASTRLASSNAARASPRVRHVISQSSAYRVNRTTHFPIKWSQQDITEQRTSANRLPRPTRPPLTRPSRHGRTSLFTDDFWNVRHI